MYRTITRALALAFFAALLAVPLAAGTASAEQCDPLSEYCGGDPGGPTPTTAKRTLTVSRPAGATVTGSGINCGATCTNSVTVGGFCDGADCSYDPATTWSLTATAPPAGYTATWTGCDSATQTTCTASAGDEFDGAASVAVSLSWADTQKPSLSFAQPAKRGPNDYTVAASATDNSGAVSYDWTVAGAPQSAHGPSLSMAGFGNGSYAVSVSATDGVNRSDAITRTVVVDKQTAVAPGAMPTLTNAATVAFPFTADADVASRECSVNGGAPASCTSGTWSGITAASADGTYTYAVKVTDDVGNTATATAATITLDRTKPTLAFTDGPTEGQQVVTRNVGVTFSQADSHPGTVACSLDGTPVACAPGSAVALTGLADGQHAFVVTATDGAGNTRTITRTFAVQVPTDPGTGGGGGGGGTPSPGGGTPASGGGASTPAAIFDPAVSSAFGYRGVTAVFNRFLVKRLPATAKVTLTCKGGGCPAKRRTLPHKSSTLNLLKLFKRLALRPGATLQLRMVGADGSVKVADWKFKPHASKFAVRCAAPGKALHGC